MELSLGEIAALLGSACGAPQRIARGYSIDSRTVRAGELFLAIRGPRFDGHRFVGQALARGAAGAVVEQQFRDQAPRDLAPVLIPVRETTQALADLARAVRRKWGHRVIAVTGSIGKTTTKELIAAVLETRLSVHKSAGNLNNQFGVPLAVLALDAAHDVAVLELGMSHAGEIERLARIAEPEIGVVTNVAPVHLEFFESIDSIARAKRELVENLKSPAIAILNHDDPRVRRFAEGLTGRVVTYGLDAGADFRAIDVSPRPYHALNQIGTSFRVDGRGLRGEFYLPLPGWHNVANALAAVATASLFDVDPRGVFQAFYDFKPPPQRTEILALTNNAIVIDDCYNSNPRAMEQMLRTLADWPAADRRIVVAGEMLELGPSSAEWHRRVGRTCVECRVDWLLAVQGDAQYFVEGAAEAGLAGDHAWFFSDAEQAGAFCHDLIQPEDVVLVKGSRGVHLERVIEMLRSSRAVSRA